MRALFFLFSRTLANGVRRALTSPQRLIGLIIFVAYNLWWLPRIVFRSSSMSSLPANLPKVAMPPVHVIDSFVFALFAIVTIFLMLNVFGYKGGFKPADVDVLFPTPVSPKVVLIFRLVRDYLLTLIVPLFFLVIFWKPANVGFGVLFSNLKDPNAAPIALRSATLAYFLVTIAWVAISYAAGIFFNRPEERVEKLKRIAGWCLFFLVAGVTGVFAWQLRQTHDFEGAVTLLHSPFLRSFFFLAWAASAMTTSPLSGDWVAYGMGVGGLLAATGIGLGAALWLSPYLYEQAAQRAGTDAVRLKLRRGGDVYGLLGQQAAGGKMKVRRLGILDRARVRGPAAIVWLGATLTLRTMLSSLALFAVLSVGISVAIASIPPSERAHNAPGILLLVIQSTLCFAAVASAAQPGFMETLRRVDLLKPLPFSSMQISIAEVLGKATPAIAAFLLGLLVAAIMRAALLPFALAGMILLPSFAFATSALFFLLVVLLPDLEDPTQRGFRGLVTMLGLVVFVGPPIGLFALLTALHVAPILAAVPSSLLMILLGIGALHFASRLFASFNPSE